MKNVLLFACVIITSCTAALRNTSTLNFTDNAAIAHRGAFKKNKLPENSIAALKEAIRLQCAGSEFDVRMTADDSLIINHDPEYNKLSIETNSYADLIKYKLSNGEKLPTLREYILAGLENNSSTRLVCEIKPSTISKERGEIIAAKVVHLFRALKAQRNVTYISFEYSILKKIISINPKAITQYLNGDKTPLQLKADGITGADYHFSVFKTHPDWVESAKANNIALNAWTVNDPADMDWLLANKFDFITTNEPELLFEQEQKAPIKVGWKLVWSDEFNKPGLPDSSKWSYDAGTGCPNVCGWGNNELQYYTVSDTTNAIVKNGKLTITALKKKMEKSNYTSARLVSKNKGDWKYGRIEVKAKLPAGRGMWPAIWMLPTGWEYGGWPSSGEIDIMENVGFNPDTVFSSVHTKSFNHGIGTQKTKGLFVKEANTSFHLYSIEWNKERIDFFIDNNQFFSFANTGKGFTEWPFDKSFHLLLNIAVGGNWGGMKGIDETISSASMEVDFVRVYQ